MSGAQAQTCVITGAASGIGAALAEVFVERGFKVIGIDRDAGLASEVQARLGEGVRFLEADLVSKAGLESLTTELANVRIDVLIHSAGINAIGAFEGADLSKNLAVLEVNLRAPVQLTRALLAGGSLQRGSNIVFISSLSHFVSYPGAAVYAASKDGLVAYARSLSVALKPQGIHVLSVFPGPTRTPHAAKYSPDNSREAARMSPDVLAQKIVKAVENKRHRLVPGWGNKLFALAGTWLPATTERIMVKTLFEKMTQ